MGLYRTLPYGGYFDYGKEQKGYRIVAGAAFLKADDIKSLIGKKCVYLLIRDYDPYRGYLSPRYDTISGTFRRRVYLSSGNEFAIADLLELGIVIEGVSHA